MLFDKCASYTFVSSFSSTAAAAADVAAAA